MNSYSQPGLAIERGCSDGRSAVVDAASREDLFDNSWDARTQVHEYGGAAAIVFDGVLYFSHFTDGRVYRCERGSVPEPVTPGKVTVALTDGHPDQEL